MLEGTDVSQFRFDSANIVAVGTFNIHIFTPQWLTKCELISGEPANTEFALSRPGIRFQLRKDGPQLTVEPHRIVISTHEPTVDCGKVLGIILRRLPETPLVAVGTNVVYSTTVDENEVFEPLRTLPQTVGEVPCSGRSVALNFAPMSDRTMSISLHQSDRLAKASGNDERRSDDVNALIDAAETFQDAIERLTDLLRSAWTIQIKRYTKEML